MMKYVFCMYDVWGNEEDFEVNNISRFTDKPIFLHDDSSTEDILRVCAAEGFINGEAVRRGFITVDTSCSPDYYEFVDNNDNIPFARIELIQEA